MNHPSLPRVALLVDTATGWGREIVEGVISYADSHGPWDIHLRPSGAYEAIRLPANWRGDGVIARVITNELAVHLKESELPVVNISGADFGRDFCRVSYDNLSTVEAAVDHLSNRGIRSFGYYGAAGRSYSLARQEIYQKVCEERGYDCSVFSRTRSYGGARGERERLKAWLCQLPHTTGVLTWGVERGVEVINAACAAGLHVPENIAVLGGHDDDLICRAVRPSLSGIHFAAEQIGYEAAHMLHRMLKGEQLSEHELAFKPAGIKARASTDVLAIRDELLAREQFDTLLEAKVLIERWRRHYNTVRPHSSLGYRPRLPKRSRHFTPFRLRLHEVKWLL